MNTLFSDDFISDLLRYDEERAAAIRAEDEAKSAAFAALPEAERQRIAARDAEIAAMLDFGQDDSEENDDEDDGEDEDDKEFD